VDEAYISGDFCKVSTGAEIDEGPSNKRQTIFGPTVRLKMVQDPDDGAGTVCGLPGAA
jgi:hypothetical protein